MSRGSNMIRGWKATRRRVYSRDHGLCWVCGLQADADNFDLDHVIARQYGGEDKDYNLRVAHPSCNRGRTPRAQKVRLPWATPSRW